MSGIRKKFSFQLLYAFSQLAFPLITYPYITRKIGAAGIGIVGYVEFVSGFIITLASFGIPFFGVREIAKLRDDPQKKQAFLRQLFSIHLLVSLLGCAVFALLLKTAPRQEISNELMLLGCLNILLPAFIAEWYMQGSEAFVFTTVRGIVLRFLGLIALLVFVTQEEDYLTYYLIIVSVQATIAVSNMAKIGWRNFIPVFNRPRFAMGSLWHFFLTTSVISVYVFFDVIVLGWVGEEANVGYYTIAIKIVKLSLLIVLSLNVILFPRISYLRTLSDHDAIGRLVDKGLQFILVLTIPLAAFFYCLAPEATVLVAGRPFTPSIPVLQVLCALPLIIGISNLFCYQIIIPFGGEKKLLLSVVITCVCSIALHYFLAKAFLEKGTAAATLLTETIMLLASGFFAAKLFSFKFPLTTVWQTCMAVIPFFLITYLIRGYTNEAAIIIVASSALGAAFYLILQLLLFKNTLLIQLWQSRKVWRMAYD